MTDKVPYMMTLAYFWVAVSGIGSVVFNSEFSEGIVVGAGVSAIALHTYVYVWGRE